MLTKIEIGPGPTDLGQVNYNAYCDTRDWKSFDGKPLPPWEQVKPDIQEGWRKGADAVAVALLNKMVQRGIECLK
jgi:hypothetical protein